MSWSVSASGTDKAKVAAEATAQFDRAAENYKGTEEAVDVAQAKERALSMLGELDLAEGLNPGDPPQAASVSCYGSRSSYNGKVVSASLHVAVERRNAT